MQGTWGRRVAEVSMIIQSEFNSEIILFNRHEIRELGGLGAHHRPQEVPNEQRQFLKVRQALRPDFLPGEREPGHPQKSGVRGSQEEPHPIINNRIHFNRQGEETELQVRHRATRRIVLAPPRFFLRPK